MLLALTQAGVSREAAYGRVQTHAMAAWQGGAGFADRLKSDREVTAHLSPAAIDGLFDPAYHVKHVDTIFRRVFGGVTPSPYAAMNWLCALRGKVFQLELDLLDGGRPALSGEIGDHLWVTLCIGAARAEGDLDDRLGISLGLGAVEPDAVGRPQPQQVVAPGPDLEAEVLIVLEPSPRILSPDPRTSSCRHHTLTMRRPLALLS